MNKGGCKTGRKKEPKGGCKIGKKNPETRGKTIDRPKKKIEKPKPQKVIAKPKPKAKPKMILKITSKSDPANKTMGAIKARAQVGDIDPKVKFLLKEGRKVVETMQYYDQFGDYESSTQGGLYRDILSDLQTLRKKMRRSGITEARKIKLKKEQSTLIDRWSDKYVKEHNEEKGKKGSRYYFLDSNNPSWLKSRLI